MSSSVLGPEWNLSPDGIDIVTESGALKDPRTILKRAVDSDLKAIGKSALSSELSKSKVGKIVLQIQKIRNISAPKAKEESQAAPRMLKLTLTDGESYVQAIEITSISSISREKTAPGTKVVVNGASVVSGYMLIGPQNFTVLGGQVEHLYDKWVVAKSIQKNHQYVSNDGAPPWVAFGSKIVSALQDKPFKSLEKDKEGNGDSEFDQQRKEAIAEASTGAVRKTFGGRMKLNVQQPAQNNQQYNNNRGKPNDRGDQDRGRRSRFGPKDDDSGVERLQKPSEKVSLFSFLEDKLPVTESKKPAVPSPSCNKDNCQNYHQKDPRIQQRSEARSGSKQHEKASFNSNTSKEKPSYNGSAMKQSSKSLATRENLKLTTNENENSSNNSSDRYNRQQNYNKEHYFDTSQQQYQAPQNQYRNSNDKYNQGAPNNYRSNNDKYPQYSDADSVATSYNPGPQQNHYRNNFKEKYTQQQNVTAYPKGNNYGQQDQNQYKNPRQQYSNANSYPQPNTHYNLNLNQKPPQTTQSGPATAEMHQLANNLSKISVSNEFASRSLRQHLNLGPPKRQENQEPGLGSLGVGDQCLAKYWEDGKFYPAVIAAITDKTYAVHFKGYGNIEEVLKHDCFSADNSYGQQNRNPYFNDYQQPNNFSGTTMEFRSRRGPPRN